MTQLRLFTKEVALPTDTLFSASVANDLEAFATVMAVAYNQVMADVQEQMLAEGFSPLSGETPALVLRFEAKATKPSRKATRPGKSEPETPDLLAKLQASIDAAREDRR